MSKVDVSGQLALLDVLIVEHRHRAKIAEDRLVSIQSTINGMVTGVVALAALVGPRLPYKDFDGLEWVLLSVAGLMGISVVITWVDALAGPMKSFSRSLRESVEEAAGAYDKTWSSLAPFEVRTALLARLKAEEALAQRELRPRQESLRAAALMTIIGLGALLMLAGALAA